MGYGTKFTLKGDLDDKFKSSNYIPLRKGEIEATKTLLVAHCMCVDNSKSEHYLEAELRIEKSLRTYVDYLEEDWKENLERRIKEDGCVHFCGWEHSRGREESAWSDIEDIIGFYFQELFLLAIIRTKSPFEKDTDYYTKQEKILDILTDLPWNVYDMWDQKFIDRYRDSEDAEEKGDDTPEKGDE